MNGFLSGYHLLDPDKLAALDAAARMPPAVTRSIVSSVVPPAPAGRPGGLGLGRRILAELLAQQQAPKASTVLAPTIGGALAGLLAKALGAGDIFAASLVKGAAQAGTGLYKSQLEEYQQRQRILGDLLMRELDWQRRANLEEFRQRADLAKQVFLKSLDKTYKEEKEKQKRELLKQIAQEAQRIDWADPKQSTAFMLRLGTVAPAELIDKIQKHIDTIIKTQAQKEMTKMKTTDKAGTTAPKVPSFLLKPPMSLNDYLNKVYPNLWLSEEGLTPEKIREAVMGYISEVYMPWLQGLRERGLLGGLVGQKPLVVKPKQQPKPAGKVTSKTFKILGIE